MHTPATISGLYAITPATSDTSKLLADVLAALQGGVRLVQYRHKEALAALREQQAALLLKLCRAWQVPLIINDDIALCAKLGADGVHLGATDASLLEARRILGAQAIIGASCYNNLQRAVQAQQQQASYVAFGACFASRTKPQAATATLELFSKTAQLGIPRVAIGGITLHNAEQVIAAGADALAVIEGLFGAADIRDCAVALSQLFHRQH